MTRVVVGPGPKRQVKRHEPGRTNPYKSISTVLVTCAECNHTSTIPSRPSFVTKYVGTACGNCRRLAAAAKSEATKQAQRDRQQDREVKAAQKVNEKRRRCCPDCGIEWVSPYSGKHLKPGSKAGNRCTECRNRRRSLGSRLRNYRIDHHRLEALRSASGRRCMNHGCDKLLFETLQEAVSAGGSKRDVFCVDHDHSTGEVRGLLCSECNFALGQLGDSLDRIIGLAAYIADVNPQCTT